MAWDPVVGQKATFREDVYRALCLGLSLKSRIALPRMCLDHTVKIANITDLSELEVGIPENDK
jgi:hypothetical protein